MTKGDTHNSDKVKIKITGILSKIDDETLLDRIYRFIKYIYIHKT